MITITRNGTIPPKNAMKDSERVLIAEKLRLALDEIETGAGDFFSIRNAVRYQREALRTAHRRLARLGGEA